MRGWAWEQVTWGSKNDKTLKEQKEENANRSRTNGTQKWHKRPEKGAHKVSSYIFKVRKKRYLQEEGWSPGSRGIIPKAEHILFPVLIQKCTSTCYHDHCQMHDWIILHTPLSNSDLRKTKHPEPCVRHLALLILSNSITSVRLLFQIRKIPSQLISWGHMS